MQGNVRVDKCYRERSVSIPLTWSNALLHQIWNWNTLSYLTIKLWLQHEKWQPRQAICLFQGVSVHQILTSLPHPGHIDHAAAGNLKTKTVPCNKFSWLGSSGFERLCWHPREVPVPGTAQLCHTALFLYIPSCQGGCYSVLCSVTYLIWQMRATNFIRKI